MFLNVLTKLFVITSSKKYNGRDGHSRNCGRFWKDLPVMSHRRWSSYKFVSFRSPSRNRNKNDTGKSNGSDVHRGKFINLSVIVFLQNIGSDRTVCW